MVGGLGSSCSCVGIMSFCSARSCCISLARLRSCSAWSFSSGCSDWPSGIRVVLHIWSACSAWPSGKCSSISMQICSALALAAPHCVPRLLGVNIGTI